MLALKIIVIVVVVALLLGTALRIRKLRRDEMRELSRPVERRLMAPPPSPYEPSRGFRLLDESGQPIARPPLERPRLDPNRRYVFNELSGTGDDSISSHPRHNDDWFLSRSSQRSTLSIFLRRLAVLVVIALVVVVVSEYYAHHHSTKKPPLSTTTSISTTTTTTTFPSEFAPTSSSGEDANYSVPAPQYQVVVRGLKGPTWAVFEMGPSNTLEWQGTVPLGKVEALTMTGDSRITLGSPSNASVHVKGSSVTFPTSLPATLVLVFTSTTSK